MQVFPPRAFKALKMEGCVVNGEGEPQRRWSAEQREGGWGMEIGGEYE